MKLRSGKVVSKLPPKLSVLEKIDKELEYMLQFFKAQTSENPKHARELLDLIGESNNAGYKYIIRSKIAEVYRDDFDKTGPIGGVATKICGLANREYPQYHDYIEERIKAFDLESPLLGAMEDLA